MKSKLAKILCIALALVMVVGIAACGPTDDGSDASPTPPGGNEPGGNEPGGPTDPDAPRFPAINASGTFTVAYGAAGNGDFINGFTNNAYDATIMSLIWGDYGTYAVTDAWQLVLHETVVKNETVVEDAAGNRTYTFELWDDLKWSDGTQITAKDFLADLLFHASVAWLETGASSMNGYGLVGWEAYRGGIPNWTEEPDDWDDEDGENPFEPEQDGWILEPNDYFEGIKLLGDLEFSITIDAEMLPYFWETMYAAVGPIPSHVWVPGINIISNENGSRFDGDISDAILNVIENEQRSPSVTGGPYKFVSNENQIVTVEVNPYFLACHRGQQPKIEFIQQVVVLDEVAIDTLFAGEIDFYPTEIRGENIERVKAEPGFGTHSYLRNGYGLMHIHHNFGPTTDVNVRWAIATLLDRQPVIDQVLGGYGGMVDTEVAEAQWMFQMKRAELAETLIPITLSVSRANDYLDQSEWRFEADGVTPFDVSQANADGTYMRHNSDGERLVIHHAAANDQIGGILEIEFLRNTPLAGMEYVFHMMGQNFPALLDHLYEAWSWPPEEQIFSTYSLAANFTFPGDPYFSSWHSSFANTPRNPTGIDDAELDRHIMAMRETTPNDNATFLENWFNYVVRFNQILPVIPLYANEYFDLFNDRVIGVSTTPYAGWADQITLLSVVD
jgi:peptide/nickel transport system substrate-binding protein